MGHVSNPEVVVIVVLVIVAVVVVLAKCDALVLVGSIIGYCIVDEYE